VGAAPVALAGVTVPGLDRLIDTPSTQEEAFGVGTGIVVMSMLVSPPPVASGAIAPGTGLAATCGVESARDDALAAGPPGISLHTVVCEAPTVAEETVPVELPAGVVKDNVDADNVDEDDVDEVVPMLVTCGTGTPAMRSGDGFAQVTEVPGVAGFVASGTGARVVSGAPDRAVAENGPGLFSGCVTMAPGTVGRLIAVLPAVATCA
jgi:hypothetical protein